MEIVNLKQGTPEWHAHRAGHRNASDAPVMMGVSPYKTRDELVREAATGFTEDVSAGKQRIFDAGHRFEALAGPLAEKIIGEEIAPLVGVSGRYSSSYDGLTFFQQIAFEHKSLNDALRAAMVEGCTGADLPMVYQVQMEHQCLTCPTIERVLFMASKWADDNTLVEERHCWYAPNLELRAQIEAGWDQFEADVAAYVAPAKAEPVAPRVMESLPAVVVQMSGQIAVTGNLDKFGEALRRFVSMIPEKPATDQDFADTEAACKALKKAEEALAAADESTLSQFSDLEQVRRTMRDLRDLASTVRLAKEKLVDARKKEIRLEIITDGQTRLGDHLRSLNERIGRPFMPQVPADFAGVIKGLRTLDSLRNAVNTELARAKVAATEIAMGIHANLTHLGNVQVQYHALFPDLAALVLKAPDDFKAVVTARVSEHEATLKKQAEDAAERERERIRTEEAAKLAEASPPAVAVAQAEPTAAAAPAPRPATPSAVVTSLAALQATPANDGATLTLGQIKTRIAPLQIDAAGLETLGFKTQKVRAAVVMAAADYPRLCDAIVAHIQAARNVINEPAAAAA
ncbi:endonuclease [Variovorax sp. PMC12]|uniref:endonuclease n=1 Tax=Variovorax sp. PMC12 TaxID=2126319 RepID=UPI000D12CDBF|nr:endonuclease [Variovorax sp. PMC12]AVQ84260.1 endonuclease [Variovorax sp. PMC12]